MFAFCIAEDADLPKISLPLLIGWSSQSIQTAEQGATLVQAQRSPSRQVLLSTLSVSAITTTAYRTTVCTISVFMPSLLRAGKLLIGTVATA